ncbi:hypothetical protein [endosymbiont GvMRE of Glomus versiforme]|uniref:hypothetical protein n=1 Tax=endosymbiont GvMRE of Glomus versiforme TaxID=2039283 RepID=UPI000EC03D45|nr:hypothetical protein [endosymbiont GvMRE of Glomus versiforme]RHZ35516.1 hypothetical protein GvMRE_IIg508 [endosymbiont GvMRE of Glomus versiforme]
MWGIIRKYLIWFFLAIVAILAFFFFWPARNNKNQEPKRLKTIIIQSIEKHEKQVGTVIFSHGLGEITPKNDKID